MRGRRRRGPKGQRKAAGARRVTVPQVASQLQADSAPPGNQPLRRAALPKIAAQPRARRAPRALEKVVEKVVTSRSAQGRPRVDAHKGGLVPSAQAQAQFEAETKAEPNAGSIVCPPQPLGTSIGIAVTSGNRGMGSRRGVPRLRRDTFELQRNPGSPRRFTPRASPLSCGPAP